MLNFISTSFSIIKKHGPKNLFLRSCFRKFLKILFPRGIFIHLGNEYKVKIIPDFIGYVNFGGKHNRGWHDCIDSLNGDEIFLDIGAHIGLYTLPAAIKLDRGKVYAFEPATVNYQILTKHIKMNNLVNVEAKNLLVGDLDKNIKFFEQEKLVSPKNSIVMIDKISHYNTVYKKQVSLDNYFKDLDVVPNVIKIDVEGAEVLVMNGAKKLITKSKPKIYLSIHPGRINQLGQSIEELLELINNLNYNIFDISMNRPKSINLDEYILIPK